MASGGKKFNDLGLGEKASAGRNRTLNKNGTFNVKKTNIPFGQRFNFYHTLVTIPSLHFIGLVIAGYLLANLCFGSIYYFIGVEHLTGIENSSEFEKFFEAFFFSAQTITTLGYGRVAPIGLLTNVVAASESMLGLLLFALATGLVYGRFSKPTAKISYSDHAVVAPYKDINGFMFRLLNPHESQLLEVEVNISLSLLRDQSDLRDFHALELERSSVIFLSSMWTVVHPINENSPLFDMTHQMLLERDAEFIVTLKAFDESFSQTVYSRTSYRASEIRWGQKFTYILTHGTDGIKVDVSRLDESHDAPLN
jgi:inward rectifier potassium channel